MNLFDDGEIRKQIFQTEKKCKKHFDSREFKFQKQDYLFASG